MFPSDLTSQTLFDFFYINLEKNCALVLLKMSVGL